ncbi:MAG: hypothetical protein JRJ03_20095, partial [Deltaproteobacteria bacterium]|nr:hypothetical protein [Deltaproteobacteria bacterium]
FDAAWNTYIVFCRPYDNVFEMLRDVYMYAVERIGSCDTRVGLNGDPDRRLAEHLMVFYWRGKIELTDPLLLAFWQKASDELRAHAIGFIGRALEQTKEPIGDAILNRLEKLWEKRFSRIKEDPANHEKEGSAFGWWFISGKLDPNWAISNLLEVLWAVAKTEPARSVLEQLAKAVDSHPVESIKCLRRIVEGEANRWTHHASRDHIRRILKAGLQQPDARSEAERIVNDLGRRGFLDFRDLVA